MIITGSSIGMDSARVYTSVSTDAYSRSKSVTVASARDFMDSLNLAYDGMQNKTDSVEERKEKEGEEDSLSEETGNSLDYLKGKFNEISTSKLAATSKIEEDLKSAIRYMLLNFLLMLIIGKNGGTDKDSLINDVLGLNGSENGTFGGLGNSIEFKKVSETVTLEHYEAEYEETTFSAKGMVKTSDGRELDFNIDVSMSRSFEQYVRDQGVYETLELRLCDPLVLNFDTPAVNISDQKFHFDLDSDGTEDEMSMLGAGSGFLALDLNGDGIINDGSELFGTKSGDGFRDLAKYDKDGNGWIDEADEIFDKLSIMCFDEDGSAVQYKLKDKNIGAICLSNKESEFSVTNQANMLNAQVRKTGIFLYETGGVGTIQHVDLAVELGA